MAQGQPNPKIKPLVRGEPSDGDEAVPVRQVGGATLSDLLCSIDTTLKRQLAATLQLIDLINDKRGVPSAEELDQFVKENDL